MRRSQSTPQQRNPKSGSRKQMMAALRPTKKKGGDAGKPITFGSPVSIEDPRILIATTLWKRPEIFDYWAERIKPLKCDVLVVGSESQTSRALVDKHGFEYLEAPNSPLGLKFNARVKYFLEHPEYTHLLLLGSDDIICSRTLRVIEKNLQKYDIVNWMDIWYYHWETGKIAYMPGYTNQRKGEPLAPARCLSRRVVQHLKGQLWDNDLTTAPDGHLWAKLKRFQNQTSLWCKQEDCVILDIKSQFNRNSFDSLVTQKKVASLADSKAVRWLLANVRMGENVIIGKNVEIGPGTVIRNNVEIRDNVSIGKNCYLDTGTVITGDAVVGDNVTVRNYVVIARGSRIGDNSFLAPRVMFNNLDTEKATIGGAAVGKNCFIGTNCVLHHGINICDGVKVGALSFVNRDITEQGTYIGQPAKKIR